MPDVRPEIVKMVAHRSEAWAESVSASLAGLNLRVQRITEEIHDAAADGNVGRCIELEGHILHELSWGLANMRLDGPANNAALLASQAVKQPA